jgi:hypothetical protein
MNVAGNKNMLISETLLFLLKKSIFPSVETAECGW